MARSATFTDPVYDGYFADPYVLMHDGRYYAYGSTRNVGPTDRAFEVLRSDDLGNWRAALK